VPEPSTESLTGPMPPRDTRSKGRRNILIVVVALVVLVGGTLLWRYLGSFESTDDAQVVVHLYPESARIFGYVIKPAVDDNLQAQKGVVSVEVDPKDYEVAVEQAQANLANAEAAPSLQITFPIPTIDLDCIARLTGPLFSSLPPENARRHQLRPGLTVAPDVYLR
jgi:membrane fusion protein (multidrug efflux system)